MFWMLILKQSIGLVLNSQPSLDLLRTLYWKAIRNVLQKAIGIDNMETDYLSIGYDLPPEYLVRQHLW